MFPVININCIVEIFNHLINYDIINRKKNKANILNGLNLPFGSIACCILLIDTDIKT